MERHTYLYGSSALWAIRCRPRLVPLGLPVWPTAVTRVLDEPTCGLAHPHQRPEHMLTVEPVDAVNGDGHAQLAPKVRLLRLREVEAEPV